MQLHPSFGQVRCMGRVWIVIAVLIMATVAMAYAAPVQTSHYGRGKIAEIEKAVKRFAPEVNAQRYVQMAQKRRADVQKMIEKAQNWVRKKVQYRRANTVMKQTAQRYQERYQEWLQIRRGYLEGNIDENTYFLSTKELLLDAIAVTRERLEAIAAENPEINVDSALGTLAELEEEVRATESLEELRAIYPEVRKTLAEIQREYVFKGYAKLTLHYSEAILAQLDLATAKLAAAVDQIKAQGTYDENIDTKVTEIFAKIDTIRTELNTVNTEVESGEITVEEFNLKILELREKLRQIFQEIRELYRKILRYRIRMRAQGEVNA